MLPLFIWSFIGIIVHLLINGKVDKSTLIEHGIYVVIAAVIAYFGSTANLTGWFLKAIFCAGGFVVPFAEVKLKQILNQA